MIIRKKVKQKYFQAVEEGRKRFEVRLTDFKSKPGDTLILEEQEEGTKKPTGRKIECEVLYVFNIKDVEKDNSSIGTIFFIPKKKGEMMVGAYRHCGIIYDNKTYEILDETLIQTSLPSLKKEKAILIEL